MISKHQFRYSASSVHNIVASSVITIESIMENRKFIYYLSGVQRILLLFCYAVSQLSINRF